MTARVTFFLNNMSGKIFGVWQFREKWDCLIQAVRTGSSILKYWTGMFLQVKAVDKNKDKLVFFRVRCSKISFLWKTFLRSQKLGGKRRFVKYLSRVAELHPRPQQVGMGAGGARRKGGWGRMEMPDLGMSVG